MARTKKEAVEASVNETAVAETTKAPAKKAPTKKAPAKKAAPKKVAPKKPASLTTTPTETKVNFFVEFGGVQVSIDEVVKNIKTFYGKNANEVSVYLKPEESKAYFVADGEERVMDVFFC